MYYFSYNWQSKGGKIACKMGVAGVFAYMKTPLETGLFWQILQCAFGLYPFAPPELIASIQDSLGH